MSTSPADAPLGTHPSGASTVAPIVRTLMLVQHVVLLTLVAVSVVRGHLDGASTWSLAAGALALLLWYAAGLPSSRRLLGVRVPSRWWLAGLVLIWLLLLLLTREAVWIAFSLWLLIGYFLPLREAVVGAVVVLAAVLVSPLRSGGTLAVADVLGPVIGAAVALAISRGQQQLVREAIERQRLVESLIRAQQEAAVLHGELAAEQRNSGILAERTRLSRDIHDTLAQGFSSILLLARAARSDTDTDHLHGLLAQIEASAAANLAEARRVVGALAPKDLESHGLPAALRRQLDTLSEVSGIRTELHVDGDLTVLPTATEVALLRTAQGALANVRQHADARRVVVTLTDAEDTVRLDIVDDGRGFDATGWAARAPVSLVAGGYGLTAMRSRLRELGGELHVESRPGEGAALSAQLPLGRAVQEEA